jgi:hypothetical protein
MASTRIMAVINRTRYGVTNTHTWSLLALIIVALNSCASISLNNDFKRIASKFTYYYTGEDTGIDSVLNVNGFFYDSLHVNYDSNIMFFKNGMVVENIVDGKRLKNKEDQNIALLLNEICEFDDIEHLYDFYNVNWGSYKLCGDTIKIQMIKYHGGMVEGRYGYVMWYKILDRCTVQKIYVDFFFFSDLPESKRDEYTYYPDECTDIKPLTYKEACLPSTDKAFILKHKWFWKDESKWREFMQRVYPNEKIK